MRNTIGALGLADPRVVRTIDGGNLALVERGVDLPGYWIVADRHEGGRWLTLWKLPTLEETAARQEAEKAADASRARAQAEADRGMAGLGFVDGIARRGR